MWITFPLSLKPQISVTLSHFFNWPRETSKYGGVINKKPVFLKQELCRYTVSRGRHVHGLSGNVPDKNMVVAFSPPMPRPQRHTRRSYRSISRIQCRGCTRRQYSRPRGHTRIQSRSMPGSWLKKKTTPARMALWSGHGGRKRHNHVFIWSFRSVHGRDVRDWP